MSEWYSSYVKDCFYQSKRKFLHFCSYLKFTSLGAYKHPVSVEGHWTGLFINEGMWSLDRCLGYFWGTFFTMSSVAVTEFLTRCHMFINPLRQDDPFLVERCVH